MLKSDCKICLESITDPVCIDCYLKQIKIWLNDHGINSSHKKFAIKKIKEKLFIDTINEAPCILCGKENVSICYYCISYITQNILKKLKISRISIENFSESFNCRSF